MFVVVVHSTMHQQHNQVLLILKLFQINEINF